MYFKNNLHKNLKNTLCILNKLSKRFIRVLPAEGEQNLLWNYSKITMKCTRVQHNGSINYNIVYYKHGFFVRYS